MGRVFALSAFMSLVMGALVSASLQAAEVLHVKSGETHTWDAKQPVKILDQLILEDGAILQIPSEMDQLQLEVANAKIGKWAKIIAVGVKGADGGNGADSQGKAEQCKQGARGAGGGHGQAGTDGVSLSLTLAIASLDS